jgi:hypothetical protein
MIFISVYLFAAEVEFELVSAGSLSKGQIVLPKNTYVFNIFFCLNALSGDGGILSGNFSHKETRWAANSSGAEKNGEWLVFILMIFWKGMVLYIFS